MIRAKDMYFKVLAFVTFVGNPSEIKGYTQEL